MEKVLFETVSCTLPAASATETLHRRGYDAIVARRLHSYQTSTSRLPVFHHALTLARGVHYVLQEDKSPVAFAPMGIDGPFLMTHGAFSEHDTHASDAQDDVLIAWSYDKSIPPKMCTYSSAGNTTKKHAYTIHVHVVSTRSARKPHEFYVSDKVHALIIDYVDSEQFHPLAVFVQKYAKALVEYAQDVLSRCLRVPHSIGLKTPSRDGSRNLPCTDEYAPLADGYRVTYINLRSRADRAVAFRRHWESVLRHARITKYDAVEPGDVRPLHALHHNMTTVEIASTPGEVACALSHMELWKTIADLQGSEEHTWHVIMEDDAIPVCNSDLHSTDFEHRLQRALRAAATHHAGWVSLSTDLPSRHLFETIVLDDLVAPGVRYLTTAYAMNAHGARLLLQLCAYGSTGIDVEMMLVSEACVEFAQRTGRGVKGWGWTAFPRVFSKYGVGIVCQDPADSDLNCDRKVVDYSRVLRATASRKRQIDSCLQTLVRKKVGTFQLIL